MKGAPNKKRCDQTRRFFSQFTYFLSLLAVVLLASVHSAFSAYIYAAEPSQAQQKSEIVQQRRFASPEEAVKALQATSEAKDNTAALSEIFGPEVKDLLTGDEVQDKNNSHRFAAALAEGCTLVKEGEDKVIIEVGVNNWPMPIPLVKANGQWYFDTAAGKEEIINRHIGKDELCAIGVCRAYVKAQRQYASMNGGTKYAQKFMSTAGQRDGLYWPAAENEPTSPFGPLVAKAHAQGYGRNKGKGLQPFHGYYFRILTRQGKDAPGGKIDYISHGNLIRGFALVAYPANWDYSGIMTFIVNQDGKVYQQNFGEKTAQIVAAIKEYNPDSGWKLVEDEGILNVESEK
jgi:hypothetical protein